MNLSGLESLSMIELRDLGLRVRNLLSHRIMSDPDHSIAALNGLKAEDHPAVEPDPVICSVLGRDSGCPYCREASVSSTLSFFIASPAQGEDGSLAETRSYGCSRNHWWNA